MAEVVANLPHLDLYGSVGCNQQESKEPQSNH